MRSQLTRFQLTVEPAMASLQDQLKQAGLIDEKKAKQANRARRKEQKLARKSKDPVVDTQKQELEHARAEKIAGDKALNQQKNAKAQRKAIAAQIKQLIQTNAITRAGEEEFNFSDGNKIKHIWVSKQQIDQLSKGVITIVKQGDQYILVPLPVAEKIAQRDTGRVVFKAEKSVISDADDPYAQFKIPDDLMW